MPNIPVFGVSNLNEHSSRSHVVFRVVIESATKALEQAGGILKEKENLKSVGAVRVSEMVGLIHFTLLLCVCVYLYLYVFVCVYTCVYALCRYLFMFLSLPLFFPPLLLHNQNSHFVE